MPRPEQALFALSDNLLAAKREQVNQSSKPASSQGSVPASSGFKDSNTQTNAFNPTGPTWGSLPPTRAPSFTKPLERAPADRIVTEQEGKDDTYRPTFGTGSSRYSRSLQYPLSSHRETSRGEGERPRFEIRMNEERQRVSDQQDESFNPDLTSNWSHLRRRNQRDSGPPASDASPVQYNPVFDEYSRQREQRQQEARNRAFVGFSKDEQTKAWNDVTRVPSGGLSIRRLPLGKDPMFEPAQRGEHTPTTMAEGSVEPKQPRWAQSANQIESSESASGGRSTSKSATGAGFSELSTLEEKPRGRDRDKLRRREQFIVAYENNNEDLDKHRSKEDRKKQRKLEKAQRQQAKAEAPTPIYLPEFISVSNLATALRVRIEDFVHKMEELGFEAVNYDHVLNAENAGLIAMEYNYEPIVDEAAEESQDLKARPAAEDQSSLPQRPPVVTIMGHVDHGKTTILDYLRKSSVAATEHGGITQHIGAFSVSMASGKVITFLDTPGHAAFLSMRQRGATVTDMVILVVAADDSVKPQTLEAIKHAKAAQVPIIVAVNKIDKPEADVEKVKQDLARHGVEIEDFGGDTQVVGVSGKTGQGIDKLEEEIVTLSEVLDHRAETDGAVEGWVLEATTKKAGRVATVLVRRGTLQPGNIIVAGRTWARVRSLRNEAGVQVEAAGPGTPVEVDGWKDQPVAGDEVLQAPNEQKASSVVEYREELEGRVKMAVDMEAINEARRLEQEKREREEALAAAAKQAALDGSSSATADPTTAVTAPPAETTPTGPQEVFFVVKADVSGSVEAVVDYVSQVGNTEVRPHILRSGVGAISEFDIEHAAVARGHVISFNTAVDASIAQMAERRGVSILDQNIIYRLVDDVKAKLSEKLPPAVTQRVVGEAEVAQAFSINVSGRKMAKIAGCRVRNGVVGKSARVRVLRNKEVVYD
ncbi:translation initiation factor IF-2, partial [Cryomyces antarcticus]